MYISVLGLVCVCDICVQLPIRIDRLFKTKGRGTNKERFQLQKNIRVACTDMRSVYACRILLSAGVHSYTDIKDKSIAVAMYSLYNLSVL